GSSPSMPLGGIQYRLLQQKTLRYPQSREEPFSRGRPLILAHPAPNHPQGVIEPAIVMILQHRVPCRHARPPVVLGDVETPCAEFRILGEFFLVRVGIKDEFCELCEVELPMPMDVDNLPRPVELIGESDGLHHDAAMKLGIAAVIPGERELYRKPRHPRDAL